MERKKKEIEVYIRNFFDEFSEIDSKVFSDLKKSIQENEANMILSMEAIKSNVSKYFNESPPEKDKNIIRNDYERNNFLKNNFENKQKIRPIKLTKEEFEEMDKATNGMMSLQMDKIRTLNNFYGELEKIK